MISWANIKNERQAASTHFVYKGYFFLKRIILLAVLAVGFCLGADEVTIVTVETDLGSFEIQMLEDAAPATATNFLNYVTRGDYNGSFLHRSVPGFIVQGGGFFFDSTTGEAPPSPRC